MIQNAFHDVYTMKKEGSMSTLCCLVTLVDTLCRVEPDVSIGTLQVIHENICHVISTLQFSEAPITLKGITLKYLDQGQKHLARAIEDGKREEFFHFLKESVLSLTKAILHWKLLFFVSAFTPLLE